MSPKTYLRSVAAALEGNVEGNAPDRDVLVFLPPSYAKERSRRSTRSVGAGEDGRVGITGRDGQAAILHARAARGRVGVVAEPAVLQPHVVRRSRVPVGIWRA
jgi:hypothetical protein